MLGGKGESMHEQDSVKVLRMDTAKQNQVMLGETRGLCIRLAGREGQMKVTFPNERGK